MPNRILNKLAQLAGPARLSVIRLRGAARFGDAELAALYVGNGSNLRFLSRLFFREPVMETLDTDVHPLRLRSTLAKAMAGMDLTLSETPPLWATALPRAVAIRIPAWLRQELVLPREGVQTQWLLPRRLEREVARYLRRHEYVMDFTATAEALRIFFHRFYLPYVQSRFGAASVLADEGEFMKRCQGQTLARLHTGGDWVAGMLIELRGCSLRFGRFGAATNPPAPGASEVLDTLLIRRAHSHGVNRIVMGDSRPCLSDGVVRYKAKFGATLTRTLLPQPVLCINIERWGSSIVTGLERQPLVTLRRGKPYVYRVQRDDAQPRLRLQTV